MRLLSNQGPPDGGGRLGEWLNPNSALACAALALSSNSIVVGTSCDDGLLVGLSTSIVSPSSSKIDLDPPGPWKLFDGEWCVPLVKTGTPPDDARAWPGTWGPEGGPAAPGTLANCCMGERCSRDVSAAARASASACFFLRSTYFAYVVVLGTTSDRNSKLSSRATAFANESC